MIVEEQYKWFYSTYLFKWETWCVSAVENSATQQDSRKELLQPDAVPLQKALLLTNQDDHANGLMTFWHCVHGLFWVLGAALCK